MALGRGGVRAWAIFGELGVRGLGDATSRLIGFNLAARRGVSIFKNLTRGVIKFGKRLGFLIKTVTLASTVIGGVGVAAVNSFAKFNDAMTNSLAIMGEVTDRMRGEMSAAAEQVGRTTRFSAEEAAEAFFFLASAGLNAQQSLKALPAVTDFAQAGMFNLAKATELAADAQKAIGLAAESPVQNLKNLRRVTDTLVKANTLAQATVVQFGEALTNKVAARARSLNVPLENTVALLAVMAERGLKGRRAGQQLNIVMRDLVRFALQNKEAFREFGLRVFDSEGNMRNFADILADIEARLQGLSTKEKTASIQMLDLTRRSNDVLVRLIGTSERLREFQDELKDAGGFAKDVAGKQLRSLSAQFELLQGTVGTVARDIGKALAPAILSITMNLQDFFATLDSSQIQSFFTSALGTALSGVDKIFRAIIKGVDFVQSMDPLIQKLGLFGFLFFGAKGAAVIALLQTTGKNLGENLAKLFIGQTTEESVLSERIENLEKAQKALSDVEDQGISLTDFRAGGTGIMPWNQVEFPDRIETVGEALEFVNAQIRQNSKSLSAAASEQDSTEESAGTLMQKYEKMGGLLTSLTNFTNNWDAALFRLRKRQLEPLIDEEEQAQAALASLISSDEGLQKFIQVSDRLTKDADLEEFMARVRQGMERMGETANRAVEMDLPSAAEQVGLTPESISASLRKSRAELRVQMFKLGNDAAGAVKNLKDMTRDEFSGFLDAAIERGASPERISVLIDAFSSAQRGLSDTMARAGKNIGQSLVSGIIDGSFEMEDFLKTALSGLVNAALFGAGGLFGALGIFSPSRVTMEAGRQITRGLAVGIESETNRVQRAMRNVGAVVSGEAGRFSATTSTRLASTRGRPALTAPPVGGGRAGGGPQGGVERLSEALREGLRNFPAARDPRQEARDRDWKRFVADTIEAIKEDGGEMR